MPLRPAAARTRWRWKEPKERRGLLSAHALYEEHHMAEGVCMLHGETREVAGLQRSAE
jgi:hypothetical protein